MQDVVVATGALASAAFLVDHGDRALCVLVPSLTGQVFVHCAQTLAVTSAGPWYPVQRQDGSGGTHIVSSGPGAGFIWRVPTPYVRIVLQTAQTTAMSFQCIEVKS